jgi:hypothetical protein
MRVVRFPIREAAAASVLLAAGAMGLAPAAQASDLARPQSGLILALSPLPVSSETPSYAGSGAETAVRVTTDKSRYQQGAEVFVIIRNGLSAAIYAPPPGDPSHCSVVDVQRLEAGAWVPQGDCEPGSPDSFIEFAANSKMTGSLAPPVLRVVMRGPFVGKSSGPYVVHGDVRELPPVEPLKPGDPIPVVPQAQRPLQEDVSGARAKTLALGTYRFAFSFTVGSRSQPAQTVYSEAFIVDG